MIAVGTLYARCELAVNTKKQQLLARRRSVMDDKRRCGYVRHRRLV